MLVSFEFRLPYIHNIYKGREIFDTSLIIKENNMKKTKSTNPLMQELIKESTMKAYDEDAPIWRDVAKRLLRSKSRAEINISRIARHTKKNDIVLVPGKLLGSGSINHPVTVGAVGFSEQAKEKLASAGGKHMSVKEMMSQFPKGTDVKIME